MNCWISPVQTRTSPLDARVTVDAKELTEVGIALHICFMLTANYIH